MANNSELNVPTDYDEESLRRFFIKLVEVVDSNSGATGDTPGSNSSIVEALQSTTFNSNFGIVIGIEVIE